MICQEIAEQVASVHDELPEDVVHASKRALIDWVAALLAGRDHGAPQALRRAIATTAGRGAAEAIGVGHGVDSRTAALLNATAAHATEVDDIYRDGLYHPGAPTIAAALATAQANAADGPGLLRGVAIGYEIGCRISAAINPDHYRFWHTTGTVGTLGAAAAASSVMGLDPNGIANALAIAATVSAGLQQSFRSDAMAKPLHAGHAADAGVLAALCAANGLTGALDVLEGPAGFGAAMSGDVDWSRVVAPWSTPWAITQVTVKNHTACGHTFAPIDAMLALRAEYNLKPEDIGRILVETARTPLEVAGNLDPSTAFEAKFSIPYCTAAALTIGSVRLDAFADDALVDPVARELIERTELKVAEEFDTVFPTRRAARVTVTRRNGDTVSEEAWTRRGDPDSPLSDEEVTEKFIELAGAASGQSARLLLEDLWRVSDESSVAHLLHGPA